MVSFGPSPAFLFPAGESCFTKPCFARLDLSSMLCMPNWHLVCACVLLPVIACVLPCIHVCVCLCERGFMIVLGLWQQERRCTAGSSPTSGKSLWIKDADSPSKLMGASPSHIAVSRQPRMGSDGFYLRVRERVLVRPARSPFPSPIKKTRQVPESLPRSWPLLHLVNTRPRPLAPLCCHLSVGWLMAGLAMAGLAVNDVAAGK